MTVKHDKDTKCYVRFYSLIEIVISGQSNKKKQQQINKLEE